MDKKVHVLLDDYSEEIFVLAGKNDATLELSLERKPVEFLIDSGASTNVIDNDFGHLLGKGWPLGSRLWCLLWVCHFPIGILGQVWYLIVSIPDLCTITYFL